MNQVIAGKYRIDEVIGQGGFGTVHRGMHMAMDRAVAIKMLDLAELSRVHSRTASDHETRFTREARMMSQLRHPNTITIFDYGREGDVWYLVMEYVEGTTLGDELGAKGALDTFRAARITAGILASLGEAHHTGILHRDLKPDNVMLMSDYKGDEQVKVLDFGIAKPISLESSNFDGLDATREGVFVGTPRYTSPEQLLGIELSPAADLYTVGLLLWEMLLGRPAVETDVIGKCVQAHCDPTPWEFPDAGRVPGDLVAIVERALVKHRQHRYQSASQMYADIRKFLGKSISGDWTIRGDGTDPFGADPPVEDSLPGGDVIDPNVSDGTGEPAFLDHFVAPEDDRTTEKISTLDDDAASSVPGEPDVPELDLDVLGERRRREPAQRSDGEQRGERTGTPDDDERRSTRWYVLGSIAAVAVTELLIAGGVYLTTLDGEEAEEVAALYEDTPVTAPDEPVAGGRYSVDGILLAIKAAGWEPTGAVDGQAFDDLHRRRYRFRRGDRAIEVEVVLTKSRKRAGEMARAVRPPSEAVQFDEKVVLVYPTKTSGSAEVASLAALLSRYRRLVEERAEQ